MQKLALIVIIALACSTANAKRLNDKERAVHQAGLDQVCEKARAKKLYPLRLEIYNECLDKGKDKTVCDLQAGDYNGDQVGRTSKFYDLPECVEAFEFRKQNRR